MKGVIFCLSVLGFAGSAHAGLITFEDLSDGTIVTNQYAGVTFSSVGAETNIVTHQPGIGLGDNFLCTGTAGIDCASETILTFSGLVNNLSFFQVGDNASGIVAQVDVFVSGFFASTVNILGFNDFSTPDFVDLSAFTNVSAIRIHDITDPGGLGWDNFSFKPAGTSTVPLPAGLGLLASAVGGLAALRRRKSV